MMNQLYLFIRSMLLLAYLIPLNWRRRIIDFSYSPFPNTIFRKIHSLVVTSKSSVNTDLPFFLISLSFLFIFRTFRSNKLFGTL